MNVADRKASPNQQNVARSRKHVVLNVSKYRPPERGHVLFETGYGPSVFRTSGPSKEVCAHDMIRALFTDQRHFRRGWCAFRRSGRMRKGVPSKRPDPEALAEHLQNH